MVRATDVTLSLSRPHEISVRTMLKGTISHDRSRNGPVVMAEVRLTGGDRLPPRSPARRSTSSDSTQATPIYCLIKAVSIDERLMQAP